MARLNSIFCSAAAMAGLLALGANASAGEAKGFAVTWFQPAMYTADDDCPDGLNKSPDFKAIFAAEGKTPEQIKDLIDHPNSKEFADADPGTSYPANPLYSTLIGWRQPCSEMICRRPICFCGARRWVNGGVDPYRRYGQPGTVLSGDAGEDGGPGTSSVGQVLSGFGLRFIRLGICLLNFGFYLIRFGLCLDHVGLHLFSFGLCFSSLLTFYSLPCLHIRLII